METVIVAVNMIFVILSVFLAYRACKQDIEEASMVSMSYRYRGSTYLSTPNTTRQAPVVQGIQV